MQLSAYAVLSKHWGEMGVLAKPSQVQLHVQARLALASDLSAQVRRNPETLRAYRLSGK